SPCHPERSEGPLSESGCGVKGVPRRCAPRDDRQRLQPFAGPSRTLSPMRLRALAALAVLCAAGAMAAEEPPKATLKLSRITSPIKVDGDLSDPGWKEATVVETFYEINPGDNIPPPVKTVARIGYDDRFFYVSFWCQDPDISKLRAPFVDRDGINDDQDYVGILLDVENTNHAAIDF